MNDQRAGRHSVVSMSRKELNLHARAHELVARVLKLAEQVLNVVFFARQRFSNIERWMGTLSNSSGTSSHAALDSLGSYRTPCSFGVFAPQYWPASSAEGMQTHCPRTAPWAPRFAAWVTPVRWSSTQDFVSLKSRRKAGSCASRRH